MDAIVKCGAGKLQGPLARLLQALTMNLFITEEFQTCNLPQVAAALINEIASQV